MVSQETTVKKQGEETRADAVLPPVCLWSRQPNHQLENDEAARDPDQGPPQPMPEQIVRVAEGHHQHRSQAHAPTQSLRLLNRQHVCKPGHTRDEIRATRTPWIFSMIKCLFSALEKKRAFQHGQNLLLLCAKKQAHMNSPLASSPLVSSPS